MNVGEMLFCKDCKHAKKNSEGVYHCQHETALLFRSYVTGDMPTCEDMRSDNQRGCAPGASMYEAKAKK